MVSKGEKLLQVYKMFIAGVFSLALCLSLAPLQASSSQGDEDKAQKLVAAYTRPILAKNLPNELLLLIRAYMVPRCSGWVTWGLQEFFSLEELVFNTQACDVKYMGVDDVQSVVSVLSKKDTPSKKREEVWGCFDRYLQEMFSFNSKVELQAALRLMYNSVYATSLTLGIPKEHIKISGLFKDKTFLSVISGFKAYDSSSDDAAQKVWVGRKCSAIWRDICIDLGAAQDWSDEEKFVAIYLIHLANAELLYGRISVRGEILTLRKEYEDDLDQGT